MIFDKTPSFKETGLNSIITEVALALSAFKDDTWYPSGTAVVIAPHLAITAKHVIQDYWKKFENTIITSQKGEEINITGSFHIVACQIRNLGKTGIIWSVTKIWESPFTDIAFIYLTPWLGQFDDFKWRSAKLDLVPPKIGTRVAGFGYHSPSIKTNNIEDKVYIEWKDSPTTTIGEVIEIFGNKRDQIMLNFPCFKINAKTMGGMSGGPIFNDVGQLCGIICAGLDEIQDENQHVSYVSSLWPSMGTLIGYDPKKFMIQESKYPVLDLAKNNIISADSWEKIEVTKNLEGFPQVRLSM